LRIKIKGASLSALIIVSLMVILLLAPLKAAGFSGSGSGTAGDPYIITTVEQLQAMENNLTAHYALGNDIDASSTVSWNGGAGFVPIGTDANRFTGSLDGRGYKIYNLYINRSGTDYVGLFGYVGSGGVVDNVGVENVNVVGDNFVGGLAGVSNDGIISNCFTTGSILGNDYIGGIIGDSKGNIDNCYSAANISGHYEVGGLFGGSNGNVSNCYATGSVYGSYYAVGGLAGYSAAGTVSNCYSTSSTNGSLWVGGLIGYYGDGLVSNSYSTGAVSGSSPIGGLIGGIAGGGTGTVSNSFWDNQTSGQSTSAGGTGKTTAQMKTKTTFTDAGWDFVNIWDIYSGFNSGYPFLAWQYSPPTVVSLSAPVIFLIAVAVIGGLLGGIAVHLRYFGRRTRQRARRGRISRRGRD
jgi:hypothetical protein